LAANTEQIGEMLDRFESLLGAMASKQTLTVTDAPDAIRQIAQLD
jgi:hypothetical protein